MCKYMCLFSIIFIIAETDSKSNKKMDQQYLPPKQQKQNQSKQAQENQVNKQQQEQQQHQQQQHQKQSQLQKPKETFVKSCSMKADEKDKDKDKMESRKKASKVTVGKNQNKGKKATGGKDAALKSQTAKEKSEDLFNALIENEKNKGKKPVYQPPDPDSLLDALQNIGSTQKWENGKIKSPSSASDMVENDTSISQNVMSASVSGLQSNFFARELRDRQLPCIPESESPLDESDATLMLPSPDYTSQRPKTPSVSIIENESVHSVSSPAPSFARSSIMSPLPVLGEIPMHSSPLPPLKEMDSQSLTSQIIESEDSSPLPSSFLSESLIFDQNSSKKLPGASMTLSTISGLSSQTVPELHLEESNNFSTMSSVEQDKIVNDINDNDFIIQLSSNDNLGKRLSFTANSVSNDSNSKFVVQPSLSPEVDLNKNIDESFSTISTDTIVKKTESPHFVSDENSPVSQIEISFKRINGSLIDDHVKSTGDIEEQNSVEALSMKSLKSVIEDGNLETGQGEKQEIRDNDEDEENEFSGENWDTDSNVFSPSDDSYLMTSSLSDSDSKHSKLSELNNTGHVSSSSNTEPILRVKIRRKALGHYRQRQLAKQQQDRKLSHNDALAIQRNAYLKSLQMKKKRSKSVAEVNSPIVSSDQHQQKQQQRLGMETPRGAQSLTPRATITHCVLCAAEGAHKHASHPIIVYGSNLERNSSVNDKQRDAPQRKLSSAELSVHSQGIKINIDGISEPATPRLTSIFWSDFVY